jgi:large subunit ribosomal protein L23
MTVKEKKTVTKPKAKTKSKDQSTQKKVLRHLDIIRYPIVTEKTTNMSAHNQVVFAVSKDATKPEIKAAIEATFGVKVKAVNTLNKKGKTKRFRGQPGLQENVKKAIITLTEGQQLDIGSGI